MNFPSCWASLTVVSLHASCRFQSSRSENAVSKTPTNTARRFRGQNRAKISLRAVKVGNQDWLRGQAQRYSAKDGASITGQAPAAFENLRQGRNKVSFDNLVEWCRNDPQFAAAFAEYVGLIMPGDAEFAGAITVAINAYLRRVRGSK